MIISIKISTKIMLKFLFQTLRVTKFNDTYKQLIETKKKGGGHSKDSHAPDAESDNIPHVEWSHQSDHILTVLWEFELGDF